MDRFVFEGFLPTKKGRTTKLALLRDEPRTLVIYESPHRLLRTLDDLAEHLGNRRIAVARELTKKFEEIVRGDLDEVRNIFRHRAVKGEFVLIVEGLGRRTGSGGDARSDEA
jgi:16S rRNA (cytidine1402-2'-O)-methyltransferase